MTPSNLLELVILPALKLGGGVYGGFALLLGLLSALDRLREILDRRALDPRPARPSSRSTASLRPHVRFAGTSR